MPPWEGGLHVDSRSIKQAKEGTMYNNHNCVYVFEDAHETPQSNKGCNESLAKTPARITPTIEDWAESDLDAQQLIYLTVTPKPWASPQQCHGNVDVALQLHGGRLAIGWTIYDTKGLWLTAELHSVWEYEGELFDITPDLDPKIKRRLFADSGRRIEHGGEEWEHFRNEMTEVSLNGEGGRKKLLSSSKTVGEILNAHQRLDKTFNVVSNQALKQGRMLSPVISERYWRAKDRLIARLESWLAQRQKPCSKVVRAKKKAERKRRRLARRRSK